MTFRKQSFAFFFVFSALSSLSAIEWNILTGPRTVAIGPEAYCMNRSRTNGSKQDGWLYGVRGLFERCRENSLYWGVEGFWAKGDLDGHLRYGDKITSTLHEGDIEGRIGFTFAFSCGYPIYLVPFLGGGYYWGTNDFHSPSPIEAKFHDRYNFWALGFLSQIAFTDHWWAGIRFWARKMTSGHCHVANDPEYSSITLQMNNKWHYRIDLPVTYMQTLCEKDFGISLVPFYEYRHLGGRENYPFDFIDTQFHNWGVRLLLSHIF